MKFLIVTERGSFIINGAERGSQSTASISWCQLEESVHTSGKTLHGFRIIPDRGTWIEVNSINTIYCMYIWIDVEEEENF